jgi:hypothetical protein
MCLIDADVPASAPPSLDVPDDEPLLEVPDDDPLLDVPLDVEPVESGPLSWPAAPPFDPLDEQPHIDAADQAIAVAETSKKPVRIRMRQYPPTGASTGRRWRDDEAIVISVRRLGDSPDGRFSG